MNKPFLLLLDGMTGSGKTTTIQLLSKRLPRTAILNMNVIKKFLSDFERGIRDNAIAKGVIFEMARKYLDLGISVVIEQMLRDEEVGRYEALARERGIACYKFQLVASPEVAYARVVDRQRDLEDKVPEDDVHRNISSFQNREHAGFFVIDTSSLAREDAAEIILGNII